MAKLASTSLTLFLVASVLALIECRDPTEVTLDIHTDVPCSSLQGVTITVGRPGEVEDKEPGTTTHNCDANGNIGTLVVVPTGNRDDEVAIKVVAGRNQDAESCKAPGYGPGCIVARRVLHYLPHTPLTLPISMRQICAGVACVPDETCVNGQCRDAHVLDPTACANPKGCDENGLSPTDGGVRDTGGPDAPSDTGATIDADVDAGVDAGVDATVDAGVDATVDAGVDAIAGGDGAVADAGVDASDGGVVVAPRPIAPLSTGTTTTRRPTFRWQLFGAQTGARVEVCATRSCATVIATVDAVGTSGAPSADLPAGIVFWRVRGKNGATLDGSVSVTWEVAVTWRTTAIDSSSGSFLDVNGDGFTDVAVGASGVSSSTGKVYVFLGSAAGLATIPATSLIAPDGAGSKFGTWVASAGDVNGDGFGDLAVGAEGVSTNTGKAYVYLGGPSGLATTPAANWLGPDGSQGLFGRSVATAGDVNGDGYSDVVVGAEGATTFTGKMYLFLGSASGLPAVASATWTGLDGTQSYFGHNVATAGDVNGDGYSDVVVGADNVTSGTGKMYLYLGSAAGLSSAPGGSWLGPDGTKGFYGHQVATAGDVNGDGYSDVIVGAQGLSTNTGKAYVYLGGASGLGATAAVTWVGPDGSQGFFGAAVGSAGDVNGDGYSDVVMGAPYVGTNAGKSYVYLGSPSGPAAVASFSWASPDGTKCGFGYAVSSGDVNGDGRGDVVVGAPLFTTSTGKAYVFDGTNAGLPAVPSAAIVGPDGTSGNFGLSLY